jgi:site-specific DNA-methyltransferase (adenine-specific)/adenine-specific DNA-methyltransferase
MKEQITIETYEFEKRKPIKGFPELHWTGKRPFESTQYFPAQLREKYGEEKDNWINKIFWGDNLQVMSHMLKDYRGKIDFIYIDPPFDSKADYKKKIKLKGKEVANDSSSFEEKQYGDIWTNDEYLQFMYERLIILRELLSDTGCIYLHCDYHKSHYLKILMDEVFGSSNHLNSLVWMYSTRSAIKTTWKRTHDDILFYKKAMNPIFNWDHEMVMEPLSENTIKKYRYEDEIGKYRLNGRNLKDSPIRSAKDVDPKYEITNPEWVVRDYLRLGKSASDYFFIDIENQASNNRTDYPTQKPEELLYKLIYASTNEDSIVFDCFMGSGTTQAVAMKLGRRFIGADINLGAIQTTTKRLLKVADELKGQDDKYTGFEVYNVNNYDFFRNPVEAKELIISALEIQKFEGSNVYDGELDGRMVKIMPVNRIATKADLEELKANMPYKTFEKRKEENPNTPVERLTLVCMGHEPDLKASLEQELHDYKLDIEIVDILRDKSVLQLKREAEASVIIEDGKLIIKEFYPLNLMQKLSLQKEYVEDWKQLVESIMIDWNYDGVVLEPETIDLPDKNELVNGEYDLPEGVGNIKVKITDLLSESLEIEVV